MALDPRYRGAAAYFGGAALAVPFLATFALLFSSADPVFARWIEDALDPRTVREIPGRLVLAGVVAWMAAGALTLLAREPRSAPTSERRPIRADAATALLVAVDLLFAVFVVLQIAYLFGGRDTVAAAGIPYSTYARRGFFELLAAAGLVALLLVAVDVLAARSRALIALGLALLPLTGVVLVSAAYRLGLYQQAYGWSELRLYALAAIVFVALALALIGVAIVLGRMRYALQPIVIAGLAVALGVNAVAPSAFIARANLDRVQAPTEAEDQAVRPADLVHLVWLGEGAVPDLVARLPTLPERERFCLGTLLRWRYARDLDRSEAWQSWNLERARSSEALSSIRDELVAPFAWPRDDHMLRRERAIEMRYREECSRR
jgi:hypothetical protein